MPVPGVGLHGRSTGDGLFSAGHDRTTLHRDLSHPVGRRLDRGTRPGDRGRAERGDAHLRHRRTRDPARHRGPGGSDRGSRRQRLRRPDRPRRRDHRPRCRPVPQHGVRQHLAARGCRPAGRGHPGRSRRGVRRPAPRHRRSPPSRRRIRPRAHLLGAEAAGRAAGAAGATGGAVRPRRHRLHQGRPRSGGPGLLAVRRARRRDRRQRRPHVLCAEPVRRSRRDAPPDRHRAHARHRHRAWSRR